MSKAILHGQQVHVGAAQRVLATSGVPCIRRCFTGVRRLTVARTAPLDGPPGTAAEPPVTTAPPTAKGTGELAKEVLLHIVRSDATTTKDILGEDMLAQLRRVLGDERTGQLVGALDGLLAHRRVVTLVFAVLDVALIWVLIKVFRTATAAHE